MNKTVKILLAIGLLLAFAAPAFAEFKLNGYFRTIGYIEEKKAAKDDGDSQQFIDQRLRMRANWTLNDSVGLVYFGEVDTTWGENNKAAINQGGMSNSFAGGSDGVNVETKQAYLDLKFGDTAMNLGIIGVADAFQSIVANDDMAAVQATHKMGNTSFKLAYSKWDEDVTASSTTYTATSVLAPDGADPDALPDVISINNPTTTAAKTDVRSDWDDFDFYVLEVNQKFNDNFKAGIGGYFMDDNRTGDGKEIYFYGLNADARFGNFGINGFVLAQDGKNEETAADYDYTGLAASVKGSYKLANGDIGLRVIYFMEDDDDEDNMRWQGFKGQYAFVSENQMQFLTDPYVMNDGKERYAEADAAQAGYGLLAFVLSGNHNLPSDMYVKWGAGYYMSMDESRDDEAVDSREGDVLGYEGCIRIGKKFFEKVDVSLNGSYAVYDDFYELPNGDEPDDTYKTYLMVNVPY